MPESTDSIALRALADRLWSHLRAGDPYLAQRAGDPVTRLPHGTPEEAQDDAAFGRRLLAEISALSEKDSDLAVVVGEYARKLARADNDYWWTFPVAPYQTYPWSLYRQQVFEPFNFADGRDVSRYLSLVDDFAKTLDAARGKLVAQAENGIALPRPALPGFLATIRAHRAAAADYLRVDEARATGLGAAARGNLRDDVERIVDGEVLPAFDRLLDHLTGPGAERAIEGVGLHQYAGGEDAYRALVRQYATYDISPERVHELGLEQVAQLTEQLADIRRAAGFTGDEAAYRAVLQADDRFHAPDAESVASTYRRHISAIEPRIGEWFSVLPKAEYGVQRLDAALEAGMSYGYYEPPVASNVVGSYRFNGSGLDSRAQISAAALILHELVPGHHFHLARQAEDTGLHPLQAQAAPAEFGAYTEGWAEYAASLGFEMGAYDDPWDAYGACVHQRFVAQRLVVDTGLNLMGWPLEKAREYMASMTMESPAQVASETLRYATDMPGQCLGYRLGATKFWQLRREAEQELGAAFDVREFHEVVLGSGTLPLTAVERNVAAYIAGRSASPVPDRRSGRSG